MNPLHSNDGKQWVSDGSRGAHLDVYDNDGSIHFGPKDRSSPYNIRLHDTNLTPSSSLYYEVEIISGDVGAGVVVSNEFRSGWKINGMFYHGKLSDGSDIVGYADYESAKKIGVYISRTEEDLSLIIYLNKRCLGSAFRMRNGWKTRDTFFPCLSAYEGSVVKVAFPETFPSQILRQPKQHKDSYSGDWLVTKVGARDLAKWDIRFSLRAKCATASTYDLSMRVCNMMNTSVKVTGKMGEFESIKIGLVMRTLMDVKGKLGQVERFVVRLLKQLDKMVVRETGDLVLSGDRADFICQRLEKKFEPSDRYHPLPPKRKRRIPLDRKMLLPTKKCVRLLPLDGDTDSHISESDDEEEDDEEDDVQLCYEKVSRALGHQNLKQVKKLVLRRPNVLEETDEYGTLLLHQACSNPNFDIIEFIVRGNESALFEFDAVNRTPLYLACANCASSDVVKFLAEMDPESVRITTDRGRTALHEVCSNRPQLETICYLIAKYPEAVLLTDSTGMLPLDDLKQKLHTRADTPALCFLAKLTDDMASILNGMLWSKSTLSLLPPELFSYVAAFHRSPGEEAEITEMRLLLTKNEVKALLRCSDVQAQIQERTIAAIQKQRGEQ